MKKLLAIFFFLMSAGAAMADWTPIIGIPTPPFGITTTHTMYADPRYTYDYSDDNVGPVAYRLGTTCGPYTHYIDPSSPNATDTNNPNGTEAVPRKTRPNPPYAPGTVIYVHSDSVGAIGPITATQAVTADKPIFIRGNPDKKPVWKGVYSINCDYLVFENFKFDLETYARRTISIGTLNAGARTHIAIRNNEFYNGAPDSSSSYQVIRILHPWNTTDLVQNIIIYNNYFHNINDHRSTPVKRDAVAVSLDINSKNIWIINNRFHQIGGDSIQIASDAAVAPAITTYLIPSNIYVGKNVSSDNYENFIDIKMAKDTVVSQNVTYNYGEGYGTLSADATPFLYGLQDIKNEADQRTNIWTLYNVAYNVAGSDGAFVLFSAETQTFSDEMYFIGNVVYNCHNTAGKATAFGQWNVKKTYWVQNIAHNCDRGAVMFGDRFGTNTDEKLVFANNVMGDLNSGSASNYWLTFGAVADSINRAFISTNIFYDNSGTGTGKIRIGVYSLPSTQSWKDFTYTQFATAYPSKVAGSLEANPCFVDPANGNFSLAAGSPVTDSGLARLYFDTFYLRFGFYPTVAAPAPAPAPVAVIPSPTPTTPGEPGTTPTKKPKRKIFNR